MKASKAGVSPDLTSFRDSSGCPGVLGLGNECGDKGRHKDVRWQAIPMAKEKGWPVLKRRGGGEKSIISYTLKRESIGFGW